MATTLMTMADVAAPESSRRSWHRRASRPVTIWMVIFVLVGLSHVGIPNYRWVLIHIFTLGIVANSIVVWSQHFTERFLHHRLDDSARPAQLRKIALLNVGAVVTLAGQVAQDMLDWHWIITQVGATLVGLAMAWHAGSLIAQLRAAGPEGRAARLAPAAVAYVFSSLCLVAGGTLGALLARWDTGTLHDQLMQAHLIVNVLGFVGLAAAGSLLVLFPAMWRSNAFFPRPQMVLVTMAAAVTVAAVAASCGWAAVTAAGLAVYGLAWLACGVHWTRVALRAGAQKANYASLSALFAVAWLVVLVAIFAVNVAREGAHAPLPTTALLVGFGGQLLLGVMSYLLPTTMRRRSAFGLRETYRAGLLRVTLINGGLIVWRLADYSWLKVAASIVCFAALVAFLPLLIRAVRAQTRPGAQAGADVRPEIPSARGGSGQVALGLALLALLVAGFGGLTGPSSNSGPAAGPAGNGPKQVIDVTAGDMVFEPASVHVARGTHVVVKVRNTDKTVHELRLRSGLDTGRINPGKTVELDAGVIDESLAGWCTIAGHHTRGMTFDIIVD